MDLRRISGTAGRAAETNDGPFNPGFPAHTNNETQPDTINHTISGRVQGFDAPVSVPQPDDSAEPASRPIDFQRGGLTVRPAANLVRAPRDNALRTVAEIIMDADAQIAAYRLDIQRLLDTANEIPTDDSSASSTRAKTFLESLQPLSLKDLPEDHQICPICIEEYRSPPHSENAIRLPCTHVMGKECLQSWLQSSAQNANNNTCPMCRAVLFERVSNKPLDTQFENSEDIVDVPELSDPRLQTHLRRYRMLRASIMRRGEHERRRLGELAEANGALVETLTSTNMAPSVGARGRTIDAETGPR